VLRDELHRLHRDTDATTDREAAEEPATDRETIAGTGPGIPDEALAPGEILPEPPSDEEVDRIAKKLGAGERD